MLQRSAQDNQLPNHNSNRLPSKPITSQTDYPPNRLPFKPITSPTDYLITIQTDYLPIVPQHTPIAKSTEEYDPS